MSEPTGAEVRAATQATDANTEQVKRTRVGLRIALAALVFTIVSNTLTWVHGARATDAAQEAAVVEAAQARQESDAGMCGLIALLIRADTPQRAPEFREALRRAYTAPGCRPPLDELAPLPSPSPGASR